MILGYVLMLHISYAMVPDHNINTWENGATGKGAEISYKLGYEITAALFRPVCPISPYRQHLFWSPKFIRTVHITSYLAHNVLPALTVIHSLILIVDVICIGPITSYLACNFHPIFHIYSSSVNAWCITSFPVCNLICFSVPY